MLLIDVYDRIRIFLKLNETCLIKSATVFIAPNSSKLRFMLQTQVLYKSYRLICCITTCFEKKTLG